MDIEALIPHRDRMRLIGEALAVISIQAFRPEENA